VRQETPERRVPSPNRYIVDAKICFCKNNKRIIIINTHTPLSCQRLNPASTLFLSPLLSPWPPLSWWSSTLASSAPGCCSGTAIPGLPTKPASPFFLSHAHKGLLLSPFIYSPPHLNTRFLSTLHLLPVPDFRVSPTGSFPSVSTRQLPAIFCFCKNK
jgi:hypothetical protein